MDTQQIVEAFRALPADERLRLAEELWDEAAREIEEQPLSEAQRRLLPILAFNVEPGDLDAVVAKLREAGIPLHGPALKMAGESVGVYLADPDGNGLSLSCNAGYPIAGLERRDPNWTPAPYAWAGVAAAK